VEDPNSSICSDIDRGMRRRVIIAATAALGGQLIPLNAAHSQEERMVDVSLFRSEDFIEGRKAEAEDRPPIFRGR
jgi:hypothetical protein